MDRQDGESFVYEQPKNEDAIVDGRCLCRHWRANGACSCVRPGDTTDRSKCQSEPKIVSHRNGVPVRQ